MRERTEWNRVRWVIKEAERVKEIQEGLGLSRLSDGASSEEQTRDDSHWSTTAALDTKLSRDQPAVFSISVSVPLTWMKAACSVGEALELSCRILATSEG